MLANVCSHDFHDLILQTKKLKLRGNRALRPNISKGQIVSINSIKDILISYNVHIHLPLNVAEMVDCIVLSTGLA